MAILEALLDLLLTSPVVWVAAILGLIGAWVAWTYLPETTDRASIAALIFVLAVIGGFVFSGARTRDKR